jgi:hypothetical protein
MPSTKEKVRKARNHRRLLLIANLLKVLWGNIRLLPGRVKLNIHLTAGRAQEVAHPEAKPSNDVRNLAPFVQVP